MAIFEQVTAVQHDLQARNADLVNSLAAAEAKMEDYKEKCEEYELAGGYQERIKEVTSKFTMEQENNAKLELENQELAEQLRSCERQYELSEEKVQNSKELARQLKMIQEKNSQLELNVRELTEQLQLNSKPDALGAMRNKIQLLENRLTLAEPLAEVGRSLRILTLVEARKKMFPVFDDAIELKKYSMAGKCALFEGNGAADAALIVSGTIPALTWTHVFKKIYQVSPQEYHTLPPRLKLAADIEGTLLLFDILMASTAATKSTHYFTLVEFIKVLRNDCDEGFFTARNVQDRYASIVLQTFIEEQIKLKDSLVEREFKAKLDLFERSSRSKITLAEREFDTKLAQVKSESEAKLASAERLYEAKSPLLQARVSELEEKAKLLEPLVEIGVAIRKRCMEQLLEKEPGIRYSAERDYILAGASAAHDLNEKADAAIYLGGFWGIASKDFVFRSLYKTTLREHARSNGMEALLNSVAAREAAHYFGDEDWEANTVESVGYPNMEW